MNKRLFTAVGVLFLLLVGWILNDLGIISIPFLSNGDSKNTALGTVTQKVKNVQRRSKDSLSWDDVGLNEKVFGYDSVLTLENSTAFIKMQDGIDLNVDQNSLITILPPDAGQDALTLNLKSGSYKVSLRKGSHLKVAGVAFNSGSDAALDFKAGTDSQIHMTVIAGAVDVISPGTGSTKRVPAAAGQAYTIDSVHSQATLDGNITAAKADAAVVPAPKPAEVPAEVIEQHQETTPVVHQKVAKRAVKKSVIQPQLQPEAQEKPVIQKPQSITQNEIAAGPGPTESEVVNSRPDPEAMSQDLSELPTVPLATGPTSEEALVANQQEAPSNPDGADLDNQNSKSLMAPEAARPAPEQEAPTNAEVNDLDQPIDMAPPEVVAQGAAAADTQVYESEMAKTNEPKPEALTVQDDSNTNASDWLWSKKRYTVWVGTSLNYNSYGQDSASTAGLNTQGFGIPSHLVFQGHPSEKWGFNLFYENVTGTPGYAVNISQWNYNWVNYGAEVTYAAKRNMNSNGEGSEVVITLGAEELSMPFLSIQPSGSFTANQDNDLLGTVGLQYNINHNKHLRYELDAHFKYPLSASAANGDSFTLQPQYGIEGSAGLVYGLTTHLSAGTDFRGEYFKNAYSFSSPSLGTAYSGNQSFLYLTFELKLGYSF